MNSPAPELRLSVVMPIYNEAATVERSIRRVRAVPLDIELVCVNDASSDGTLAVRLSLVPDGGTATVRTADGLFTGPEHVIEIIDLMLS